MRDGDDKISLNPDEWTQKELVRHLYREIKAIQEEQHKMQDTLKKLEDDLEKRTILQEEQEKRRKGQIAFAGVAGGLIGVLIEFLARRFG